MSNFSKGFWKTLGGIAAGAVVVVAAPVVLPLAGAAIASAGGVVGGAVAAAGATLGTTIAAGVASKTLA